MPLGASSGGVDAERILVVVDAQVSYCYVNTK